METGMVALLVDLRPCKPSIGSVGGTRAEHKCNMDSGYSMQSINYKAVKSWGRGSRNADSGGW